MATSSAKYQGEPIKFDPTFDGPIANRQCTDVVCCLLFVVCLAGMFAVAAYALYIGDPNRLIHPSNSDGDICGHGNYKNKHYLLFFDLTECFKMGTAVVLTGCPTPQVCVEKCPKEMWTWTTQYYNEEVDELSIVDRKEMYCIPGVNKFDTRKTVMDLVLEEKCAPYLLPSNAIMGRCMPNKLPNLPTGLLDKYNETVSKALIVGGSYYLSLIIQAQDLGLKILQDLHASWKMCVVGFIIAMVLSLLWIILMRWIAGFLIWVSFLLFILCFCVGATFSLLKYYKMRNNPEHQLHDWPKVTRDMGYYGNLAYTWLTIGVGCSVVVLIVSVLLIFLRKHLHVAILIIKEASKAVAMMKFTMLWPVVPFILQISMIMFWGMIALHLSSSAPVLYATSNSTTTMNASHLSSPAPIYAASNNTTDGSLVRQKMQEMAEHIPCDPRANDTAGQICSFIKRGGEHDPFYKYSMYLQLYQIFMLFWVLNFIDALSQVTLSGAFASYYWAFTKPDDIPTSYLGSAFYRAIRYHLGSIAFGSLLIAIVQLVRLILSYIERKLKSYDNVVVIFVVKCLKCCFWCLETVLKFICKNAYIMVAVYGKNFCTSAKNAFNLIMRNLVNMAVIDKVTGFLLFISTLFIIGILGLGSFIFFIDGYQKLIPVARFKEIIVAARPALHFCWVPVAIVIAATYVIATGFFNVYSVGVDTIYFCFLEDMERHDGSIEKPYYMNRKLLHLTKKKNKKSIDNTN